MNRRDVLVSAVAGLLAPAGAVEACTLVPPYRPRAGDRHSDTRARQQIRSWVEVLNRNRPVGDDERLPELLIDDGAIDGDVHSEPWLLLTSAGKRDEAPASAADIEPVAIGTYRAAYLVRLERRRVFTPAQDGDSCGPYEDSWGDSSETWLVRFEYNRMTHARRLPEFDDDYRELVA